MKPKDNPHIDESFHRAVQKLDENHPAKEIHMLTGLQEAVLPGLLWFFDLRRDRASGRSFLSAVVCLELAKRGNTVNIYDFSELATGDDSHQRRVSFLRLIEEVMKQEYYKRDIFEFTQSRMTLIYKGKRPR